MEKLGGGRRCKLGILVIRRQLAIAAPTSGGHVHGRRRDGEPSAVGLSGVFGIILRPFWIILDSFGHDFRHFC